MKRLLTLIISLSFVTFSAHSEDYDNDLRDEMDYMKESYQEIDDMPDYEREEPVDEYTKELDAQDKKADLLRDFEDAKFSEVDIEAEPKGSLEDSVNSAAAAPQLDRRDERDERDIRDFNEVEESDLID